MTIATIKHRTTTLTKEKLEGFFQFSKSEYEDQPNQIRWIPQKLTSFDVLGLHDDISLLDVANIMTRLGLPTRAFTLLVKFQTITDDFYWTKLKSGDVMSIDCLTYSINGTTYFDPVHRYSTDGYRADFPLELGKKFELPYMQGIATVEVVPFASEYFDARLDNLFILVVRGLFEAYQTNQRLFDQAARYSDPHEFVHKIAQQYADNGKHFDDSTKAILGVLNRVVPQYNARIEDIELKYPELSKDDQIPIWGSGFTTTATVLVYTIEGKDYMRMLIRSDYLQLVKYLGQTH